MAKNPVSRPLGLLWLTLLLSACGGGSSSDAAYTLGGSVSGLSSAGLVLANGSETLSVAAGASAFSFANTVSGCYAVSVKSQPNGQTCAISGGSGTASANVSSVVVSCRNYLALVGLAGSASLAGFSVDNSSAALSSTGSTSTTTAVAGVVISSDGR